MVAQWEFSDIWTLGEPFWLPKGVTWELVLRGEDGIKPLPQHYLVVISLALILLVVRHLFSKFITRPIGRYFEINERVVPKPVANELGERLFKECRGNPKDAEISALIKATGWTERKVQRWFRQRGLSALPNKMVKFLDSSWRACGYFSLLFIGWYTVPRKSYFYDVEDCWRQYPHRYVDLEEFCYYMGEMSFYLSLTISHCFEQRKKDFWEMLIHHIATLGLISLSFSVNYVPIGALIMLCHDIADPWLELAKITGYTRHKRELGSHWLKDKLTELFFILFAVLFYITRLYVFPAYLLHSVWYHCPKQYGPWPLHKVFFGLLSLLFVLHVFWSYLIWKVISNSVLSGHVKGDSRSDDEMTTDDDTTLSPPTSPLPERLGNPPAEENGRARHRQNGHSSSSSSATAGTNAQ
ncbi:ceramide synthase 6-like [Sycon ciliatum]|uniref:ceramide synthase 6-like n=1 Tax=Sycon ciliatum TaxID=27933 RepID=UPI0031F64EB2